MDLSTVFLSAIIVFKNPLNGGREGSIFFRLLGLTSYLERLKREAD